MEKEYEFDFDEILKAFRNGKKLTSKGGLLAPLIKQLTEAALETEIESHIADSILKCSQFPNSLLYQTALCNNSSLLIITSSNFCG